MGMEIATQAIKQQRLYKRNAPVSENLIESPLTRVVREAQKERSNKGKKRNKAKKGKRNKRKQKKLKKNNRRRKNKKKPQRKKSKAKKSSKKVGSLKRRIPKLNKKDPESQPNRKLMDSKINPERRRLQHLDLLGKLARKTRDHLLNSRAFWP